MPDAHTTLLSLVKRSHKIAISVELLQDARRQQMCDELRVSNKTAATLIATLDVINKR